MIIRISALLCSFLILSGCKNHEPPVQAADKIPQQVAKEATQQEADAIHRYVQILEPLINVDKLDGLKGKRAATPRLRKACYYLEEARRAGIDPSLLISHAHKVTKRGNAARTQAQHDSLLRNRTILERLGCLDADGMNKLRKGNAPTITKGNKRYIGELATVDHIIPRSVCPELDNRVYNLEFLPDSLNQQKGNKIGDRQKQLAKKWHASGLLSNTAYQAVLANSK